MYPLALTWAREALAELDGQRIPYRKQAAERSATLVVQSRVDSGAPERRWFVSQQPPTDHENMNKVGVTAEPEALAEADADPILIRAFKPSGPEQNLVITTPGIVDLGQLLADAPLDVD